MIITRTPYRISFFGGGTDYPEWFLKKSGEDLTRIYASYTYVSSLDWCGIYPSGLRPACRG